MRRRNMNIVLDEGASVPTKEFETSAGYDLTTPKGIIVPTGRSVIKLGLYVELPDILGMFIFARSGVTCKGIEGCDIEDFEQKRRYDCDVLLGLVDADYRGEVGILVNNHDEPFYLPSGSKIAQCVFMPCYDVEMKIVKNLNPSKRGEQGFNG